MYPNLIKSVPKEGKINFTIIKVYWVWNTYNGFTWDINCWRACYLFLVLYVINFPYLPSLRQLSALPGERAEQKLSSSTDLVRLAERRKPRGNAHVCDCGHDPLTSLPPPPHTHLHHREQLLCQGMDGVGLAAIYLPSVRDWVALMCGGGWRFRPGSGFTL